MVQGIPLPCDTVVDLHHNSRKGREPKNWLEINWRHVARWDHRLELLAQGASIEAVGAPTSMDYMPWFLSITRRWMTPRGIIAVAQYAPAAPTMTQFAQSSCHQLHPGEACTGDCPRHTPRDTVSALHSKSRCA
ncbi:serine/threonine-protein phosphatase 7 long form homolog [Amaranthus tricolor]|uniref:serine/threonine-protein phosphatase 7 long form homolog n=1 Tax=Amaranthus tricolor TaxID=29722 RepID=UPI00258A84AC|nr:serine/threonine-protein phosphatase 7 long form homolog [Amaranthus tricolor]